MAKKLLAIGGHESRQPDAPILKEFVRLSHGKAGHVVLLTVATKEVKETVADYRKAFRGLIRSLEPFDVSLREDAASSKGLKAIERSTGIFFSGGDQLNIAALLGGTEVAALIKHKYESGTVLAGTSAGATMMSSSMLLSGGSEESPRFGSVQLGPGMDFLPGTIIDTHFAQRGRYGRLMTAVSHYPQDLGIGIDEDTAMLVSGDEFRVLGSGAVTVIDAGAMTHTNLSELKHGDALELHNLTVHVLPRGSHYNLKKRKPLVHDPPNA
jgi:cyanophycinase